MFGLKKPIKALIKITIPMFAKRAKLLVVIATAHRDPTRPKIAPLAPTLGFWLNQKEVNELPIPEAKKN